MTADPILREDNVTPISFAMSELQAELDITEAKIDALLEAEPQAAMDRHPSNYRCEDSGCGRTTPDDCRKCRPGLTLIRGGRDA